MDNCKIIDYTIEWKDALRTYMRLRFLDYSNEYLEYCLDNSLGRGYSKIVINSNSEVVGCHLYYFTKVLINNEEIETQWGHDTYLDKEYRKDIGVDFLLVRSKIPAFGLGLTETNAKIRKLLKSIFFKGVYTYYTFTPFFFLSPLQKYLKSRINVVDISYVKVKNHIFHRVYSVSQINVPNNGYWNKGIVSLDFNRSADFIEKRFIKCNVHDYRVYASQDSYFVVRASSHRGIPALLLCDYRYDPSKPDSLAILYKAVKKIARRSRFGVLYFICGDKNIEEYTKRGFLFKSPVDFISSYKISPDISFMLTGGDSDIELIKP